MNNKTNNNLFNMHAFSDLFLRFQALRQWITKLCTWTLHTQFLSVTIGIILPCPKIWSLLFHAQNRETELKISSIGEIMTSLSKFFLHAHMWIKINFTHIFWNNHRKPLVRTLHLVVLKYDQKKRKKLFFYCKKMVFSFT